MQAEIIAIGDELTSGQRVDTNSAWISQRLGAVGIRVLHHSTVADDHDSCRSVFANAFERVDLVICTGGLGPTADDLTRFAIAEAMHVELEQYDDALEHIESLFTSRGRTMPPRNKVQAMFPKGSRVIPNPHGTAPGIDVTIATGNGENASNSCRCFALPGVPAEMKEMWDQTVAPALVETGATGRVILHHELKCFGLGESDCERRLPDVVRRGRVPSVGITVHKATITLRITAQGKDESECRNLMRPTIDTIRECLGDHVFAEGNVTFHQAVLKELQGAGKTLAVAEWGTDGLLTQWLSERQPRRPPGGEAAESNSPFRGGFVGGVLGNVDPSDTDALTSLAVQHRETCGTDLLLVVGQWYRSDDSDYDELTIVLADEHGATTRVVSRTSHPDIVQERTAKIALSVVRDALRTTGKASG